ncbi:MAG: tetratricopeptide repeat protein [Steroidobacteraceae bacterium]
MRRRIEDMEEKDDLPIARDPWRKLLLRGADAPPETTDARIRAAARRPLVKRPARWWLPASLAASFLLAFMLVQSQLGEKSAPALVTEYDVAVPESSDAREAAVRDQVTLDSAPAPDDRAPPDVAQKQPESPPPPATAGRAASRAEPPAIEPQVTRRAEAPATATSAGPQSPAAAPPEIERAVGQKSRVAGTDADEPAALDEDPEEIVVPSGRRRLSSETMEVTVTKYASPEVWYAAIEALRAEGRIEEAERELERLEKAHPGWLEKNHPADR